MKRSSSTGQILKDVGLREAEVFSIIEWVIGKQLKPEKIITDRKYVQTFKK